MTHVFDYIRKNKFLIFIILPAFLLYMFIIFPSGTFFCFESACGVNFWGVHGHDAIWHLAISNVSFGKFPFIAPTFSGENLYGYNYLFDTIPFLLSKVGVSPFFSYFKLLPILWFCIFTYLLIVFGRKIKDSPLFVGLFLIFNYFAGSFSYLLTLYHDQTVKGSSTLLPLPAMHMMSNLPYAFSLIFFLGLLIIIKNKVFNLKTTVIAGICIFFIMGLKFYGGMISIGMIGIYLILFVLKQDIRKFFLYSFLVGLCIISGIFLFYDPLRSIRTGSIFGFAPFALVHTITEEPNQFYLRSMTDARYYLLAHGGIGPRLLFIESINLFIFLFFYLGTRFLGFFYVLHLFLKKKIAKFDLVLIFTILLSIILTVTLVQKAEWWNTIQFFFYAIFLLTIYLTRLVYDLFTSKHKLFLILGGIIILMSLPPSFDLIRLFAVTPGATYLPKDEIKALEFLKKQPEGVVLSHLYNKQWKDYQNPNPLYRYEDTSYISAFSGKQEYLSDILQLRLTGVPFEVRLKKLQNMDCSVLNEVDYVYEIRSLLDEDKIMIRCKPDNAKKIFENKSVMIYSITK